MLNIQNSCLRGYARVSTEVHTMLITVTVNATPDLTFHDIASKLDAMQKHTPRGSSHWPRIFGQELARLGQKVRLAGQVQFRSNGHFAVTSWAWLPFALSCARTIGHTENSPSAALSVSDLK
jgi:hypothetical protein